MDWLYSFYKRVVNQLTIFVCLFLNIIFCSNDLFVCSLANIMLSWLIQPYSKSLIWIMWVLWICLFLWFFSPLPMPCTNQACVSSSDSLTCNAVAFAPPACLLSVLLPHSPPPYLISASLNQGIPAQTLSPLELFPFLHNPIPLIHTFLKTTYHVF